MATILKQSQRWRKEKQKKHIRNLIILLLLKTVKLTQYEKEFYV